MKVLKTSSGRPSRSGSMRDILALIKRMDTVTVVEFPWRSLPEFKMFLNALIDATVDTTQPVQKILEILQHRWDSLATVETTLATQHKYPYEEIKPMISAAKAALLAKIQAVVVGMRKAATNAMNPSRLAAFKEAAYQITGKAPTEDFALAVSHEGGVSGGSDVVCHYLNYESLDTSLGSVHDIWLVLVQERVDSKTNKYSVAVLHEFAVPCMFASLPVGKSLLQPVIMKALNDSGFLPGSEGEKLKPLSKLMGVNFSLRGKKLVVKLSKKDQKDAMKEAESLNRSLNWLFTSSRIRAKVSYQILPNHKKLEVEFSLSIPAAISAKSQEVLQGLGIEAPTVELLQYIGG